MRTPSWPAASVALALAAGSLSCGGNPLETTWNYTNNANPGSCGLFEIEITFHDDGTAAGYLVFEGRPCISERLTFSGYAWSSTSTELTLSDPSCSGVVEVLDEGGTAKMSCSSVLAEYIGGTWSYSLSSGGGASGGALALRHVPCLDGCKGYVLSTQLP